MDNFFEQLKKQVALDQIDTVVNELVKYTSKKDQTLHNEALAYSQKWNAFSKATRLGITNLEQYGTSSAQIVNGILSFINRLENDIQEDTSTPKETAHDDSFFTVFMASHADDMRPICRQLVGDLEKHKIKIINEIPPPYNESEHSTKVKVSLQKADLSLHILSAQLGEPFHEGKFGKTYLLEQAHLALQEDTSKLFLLPEEFNSRDITETIYRDFIEDLRSRDRNRDSLELIQISRHQMLAEILNKCNRLKIKAQRLNQALNTPKTVFIDVHPNDYGRTISLVRYLSDRDIKPLVIPSKDKTPSLKLDFYDDNFKKSNFFIIVFGEVNHEWVINRSWEALKLSYNLRLQTRIAIYMAPPKKEKALVEFPPTINVDIIDNMDGFRPEPINHLLDN